MNTPTHAIVDLSSVFPGSPLASLQLDLKELGVTRVAAGYRSAGPVPYRIGRNIHGIHVYTGDTEAAELPKELYDRLEQHIGFQIPCLSMEGTYHIDVANMMGRDEPCLTVKDAVLNLLKNWGATTVTIEYDGSGDEGWVNDVTSDVKLTTEQQEQLRDCAYTFIDAAYGGYENNEGGFGEVQIDVAAGTIKVAHNWNETTTTYEETDI